MVVAGDIQEGGVRYSTSAIVVQNWLLSRLQTLGRQSWAEAMAEEKVLCAANVFPKDTAGRARRGRRAGSILRSRACKPHAMPRLEGTTCTRFAAAPSVRCACRSRRCAPLGLSARRSLSQAHCRPFETSPPAANCPHIAPQFTASKHSHDSMRGATRDCPRPGIRRSLYLGPEAWVLSLRNAGLGAVPASVHARQR